MIPPVAVIILARDEEMHIARAIRSVQPFATTIHVVDSGSTDRTVGIARELGAQVLFHPWRSHADQFQWAVDQIGAGADWILRLDADEVIGPDLAARIAAELAGLGLGVSGVTFDRRHIFLDRWIRHGGRYPMRLLRLFRPNRAAVEQRWMDEHIAVRDGEIVHFPGYFADHNLKGLASFVDKHNRYATLEAVEIIKARRGLGESDPPGQLRLPRQAALKRRLRRGLYDHLPFPAGAAAYFLYRYCVRLGFLDGIEGLIYHALQGGWYRFLVGARTLELERALDACPDPSAKLAELARLTGLRLLPDSSPSRPSADPHHPNASVASTSVSATIA